MSFQERLRDLKKYDFEPKKKLDIGKKAVLCIGNFPKPFNSTTDAIGGAERVFLHSINLLTRTGFKVFVEIPSFIKKEEAEFDPANSDIIYIHNYEMIKDLPHLHRLLLNKNTMLEDVVLVYSFRIEESQYIKIKRYRNIYNKARFINHLHDFNPGFGFTPLFDKVIVPSKSYYNTCIEMDMSKKLKNQLVSIYNPLEIDMEKMNIWKKNIARDKFKIVCTSGKIIKNTVEKIAAQLYDIDKRFYIECYMPFWNDWQSAKSSSPNIYWGERNKKEKNIDSGKKNRDELLKTMVSSLCIIYPSHSSETYGYVFPESQLCGVPIITNDVKNSTTKEHLTDWQILPGNASADKFVEKILELHFGKVDVSKILKNVGKYHDMDEQIDNKWLSVII